MWNWNAIGAIFALATLAVIITLGKIIYVENKRKRIVWFNPEFVAFLSVGTCTMLVLWGVLFIQWWKL